MATKDEPTVEPTPESTPTLNWYFFPDFGFSVEAASYEEAVKIATKKANNSGDK